MRLSATLTTGWPDDPAAPLAAPVLDARASASGDYARSIAEQLAAGKAREILALDTTFRRRPGGARPLSRLVGALAGLPESEGVTGPLVCRVDAFTYGFLKSAKNLDLVLPVGKGGLDGFQRTRSQWARAIAALEAFERSGTALAGSEPISRERYLATRAIITRPTARDEQRALATLLLSGPSTLEELSTDLGLKYTLGSRTLAVFESEPVGVVERREGAIFALRESTLPLVLFCLRETMGLDVLAALPNNSN